MSRICLDPAYDGTFFPGRVVQSRLRAVKGALTSALATILREPIRPIVVEHTDASVHAAVQVAHLDVSPETWTTLPGHSQCPSEAVLLTQVVSVLARGVQESLACTSYEADDAIVTGARTVPEAFNSRFGALSCCYTYRIADTVAPRDPVRRATILWLPDALDVEAMNASACTLLGGHDFLSYYKPHEGAMTTRTLRALQWCRIEVGPDAEPRSGSVTLSVAADAFYHLTVRSLVEVGLAIGQGRKSATRSCELLGVRTRQSAAPVVPPHGLTLEKVTYPTDDESATQTERVRTTRRLSC